MNSYIELISNEKSGDFGDYNHQIGEKKQTVSDYIFNGKVGFRSVLHNMSQNECKQTSAVTQQQIQQDRRILLIQNVSKHPRLYKNEFLRTPFLQRHEKQQIWDKIAIESGFEKTEDAKCKWRSLINYLRQHLDSVAQKKIRRYIPNSENPEDKYVQLTDWSYYQELEFVVPYVKYAASKQTNVGHHLDITPNEIDMIIEGIEEGVENCDDKEEQEKKTEKTKEITKETEKLHTKSNETLKAESNDDELSEDEEILKEYFENMLKSTLKLPRFHQNRIKQKLLNTINDQKK